MTPARDRVIFFATLLRFSIFYPLFSIFTLAGCSKYGPVEGIVLMDDKPLPGASLTFIPVETNGGEDGPRQATCVADDEGRFQLKTQRYPGVLPGKYKVKVSKKVLPRGVKEPASVRENLAVAPLMKEAVPVNYTSDKDTPLEIDIPPGGKRDIQLNISSPAK